VLGEPRSSAILIDRKYMLYGPPDKPRTWFILSKGRVMRLGIGRGPDLEYACFRSCPRQDSDEASTRGPGLLVEYECEDQACVKAKDALR
jgi:hypothetical protein